jgi:tRNA dimethylallyltransferase
MVGLALPNEVVARRIEDRLAVMVEAGLVDEVRGLAARPEGLGRTARQALGYREVLAHVERGVPLDDALDEAARRTRAFARRQRAWFRRDPRIAWVDGEDNPFAALLALLGEWDRCRS